MVLLVVLAGQATVQGVDTYMGLVHPPLPVGCKSNGGGLLDDAGTISFQDVSCTEARMFWLQQLVDRKNLRWRVIDILVIPALPEDRAVAQMHDGCLYADNPQAEVVAIAQWLPDSHSGFEGEIYQAWVLNPELKRIQEVSPKKVACGHTEDRN